MGYVYLIGENNKENKYKIGSTKCKDINKRLKQLQTGNSNPLFLKAYYETSRPFKLETMLHNRFKEYNIIGEWYELTKENVGSFESTCSSCQDIIDSLNSNPFF